MNKEIEEVKNYYNTGAIEEWNRLQNHPFEFLVTTHMMDKYIKENDSILDIGGGPGRYSIYYAKKGCNVTLFDLSSENIKLALEKAKESKVRFKAMTGNALLIDSYVNEKYDHVFIMGPLYHLLKEEDRDLVINKALKLLKPGGMLYISFIIMSSGLIYLMKYCPDEIVNKEEKVFLDSLMANKNYTGKAFTQAFFIEPDEIDGYMEKFSLEKLHLFGQEGLFSPCEEKFLNQPKEVIEKWLEVTESIMERKEFFGLAEHLMYIGKK